MMWRVGSTFRNILSQNLVTYQRRTMCTLSEKKCGPCHGDTQPLSSNHADVLKAQLHKDWKIVQSKKLRRDYVMKDFVAGIDFFKDIAKIAEEEGHHPDLHLTEYRNVTVELWTHAIGGLSENDFIVAAKIDRLQPKLKTVVKKASST